MLEQKRPASAEPDVDDIKQEGGAGQHLDDDNVFLNRIKALEVGRFGFSITRSRQLIRGIGGVE
jgi:hypothetical protein